MNRIRFSINTLGCKVNQSESDYIALELQKRGMLPVLSGENPDFCLINTCTVTSMSDKKVRQLTRRLKSENKRSKIVVTGCFVVFNKKFLSDSGVDLIVRNKNKMQIPDLILETLGKKDIGSIGPASRDSLLQWKILHSRPLVKIQDGCEQNCTYCIIPKVRGGYKSVPPLEVLEKIRELEDKNFEEIVLTGINIGKYGVDFNKSLPDPKNETCNLEGLLNKIFSGTGIKRIRISSIEVNDVNTGLLNVLKKYEERFAAHLHIPLQSGSDKILGLMARPYNAGYYLEKVRLVRKFFPEIALTSDVMVGFPGEDESDFERTMDIVKEAGFSKVHVFKFSGREHTPAFRMAGQVGEEIKSRRSEIMRELGDKLRKMYIKNNMGRTLEVICEKIGEDVMVSGTSGNYIKVYFKTGRAEFGNLEGRIVKITTNALYRNGLMGNCDIIK
jgi:threonylcarbamoyladenosine tRNA methylthiotransferase MtaB